MVGVEVMVGVVVAEGVMDGEEVNVGVGISVAISVEVIIADVEDIIALQEWRIPENPIINNVEIIRLKSFP